ncbi:MAG: thioredoxin family protein, partial [Myxococcales bacterium]|nr:thioredoxin family protein [Myxococcales bacterium]
ALAGVLVAGLVGWRFLDLRFAEAEAATLASHTDELTYDEHLPWVAFSEQTVSDLDGRMVFVDFTADWCLTCKVNERTVLETETVRSEMKRRDVVPLKADWTRRDEVITRWLRNNGRAGVPMYLVIPADRSRAPILLPEVITPSMVTEALAAADES